MSKKVLAFTASPRKGGNSDLLCDQFLQGAKDAGNEVEKIYIRDRKINFCLGCMKCQKNGGTCVQRDDMDEILEKMVAADVLVLATPVYFYSMSAQLKVLIDRTCPAYQRIHDKKAYLIATAGDDARSAIDGTLTGFRGFLDCVSNVEEAGVIYGTGLSEIGDVKGKPVLQTAYEMGKTV